MGSHKSAGEVAPEIREEMSIRDYVYLGATCGALKTAFAPIDRAKLLLQVQDVSKTVAVDKRYKGIIDVLVRVPKEQGVRALWRGNPASLWRCSTFGGVLVAKDLCRDSFNEGLDKNKDFYKCALGNFAAGGSAGALTGFFRNPFAFDHTRVAADVGVAESREFKGCTDCWGKKIGGIRGQFAGSVAGLQGTHLLFLQCHRVIIYRAAGFGLFDTAKMRLEADGKKLNFLTTFVIAQASMIGSGLLSYPWDTVRRRLMMQAGREEVHYKNTWDCAARIVKYEGFRGLYKGALANAFRAAPGALVIAFYEKMQRKKYTSCDFLDATATRE